MIISMDLLVADSLKLTIAEIGDAGSQRFSDGKVLLMVLLMGQQHLSVKIKEHQHRNTAQLQTPSADEQSESLSLYRTIQAMVVAEHFSLQYFLLDFGACERKLVSERVPKRIGLWTNDIPSFSELNFKKFWLDSPATENFVLPIVTFCHCGDSKNNCLRLT